MTTWGAHEGMGWWMLFGGVFWILFLSAIVYFAATWSTGNGPRRGDHALDIARRRYAAGEISEEEFLRIKAQIGG